MFEVDSSLALPVPVGRVWRVLSDFNHYRDWHPFVTLKGEATLGSVLELEHKTRIRSLPPIAAQAKVTRFEPNASIAWKIGLGGLVGVEEGFELQKTEHGTEVKHRMRCSGIVALLGIGPVQRRMDRALALTNRSLSNFLARGTTITRAAPMRGSAPTRKRSDTRGRR
ncbi:SRPBCC domain-containing protein [Sphingomonas sp. A2-49]|uniref:SRPBCC domain-containing protein n=1 Tax=Sphingomonas sp. A2-49 TaxID=1391375 RepID=UPI0021D1EDA1|nr:SRPBCC domain-containing protein [Sphingomonas sp. A2-49]MCU6453348.1 SRPBCC domain-containing protein [Sphingomonas sp. A2-49]